MTRAANGAPILTPEQVADLLIRPALDAAISTQEALTTIVLIEGADLRVPVVTEDPRAAWTAEGAEIAASDAKLIEITVRPPAVKGLTIISNELAADTSPAAAQVVGDGLVRDTARKLDEAFFAGLPEPAAPGLTSLGNTVQAVDAGDVWVNVDPFAEAASLAETEGAALSGWACHPATALALAKLKVSAGSNLPLLAQGGDPALPTRRLLEGLPLFVSPYVAANTVWGLDASRTMSVVRQDAEVTSDTSRFFDSDRTAVRSVMRVGWAFGHPRSIVRVAITPGS